MGTQNSIGNYMTKDFYKNFIEEQNMALNDIDFFKLKGDYVTAEILQNAYNVWLRSKLQFIKESKMVKEGAGYAIEGWNGMEGWGYINNNEQDLGY